MDVFNNGIIYLILASVFLALVVLLSLYILIKTVLLRNQSRSRSSSHRLNHTIHLHDLDPPSRGLDPTIIASFPVFIIEQKTEEEVDGVAVAEDCVVCLSGFEDKEMAKLLPNCKHFFHVFCIDTWLASHMTCPLCRATVEPVLEPHLHEGTFGNDIDGAMPLGALLAVEFSERGV